MTTETLEFPSTLTTHHATKKKAVRLQEVFEAEYPALTVSFEADADEHEIVAWVVVCAHDNEETGETELHTVYRGEKVPELAEVLTACEDADLDPEAGYEEPEATGSIVPQKYREEYALASSNGQTCGDWLAEWLTTECHSADGFNTDDFTAVLNANNVDMSRPWTRTLEQKGGRGRFRMNGRQALEKAVALAGELRDAQGNAVAMPRKELAALQSKHRAYIEKETKKAKDAVGA